MSLAPANRREAGQAALERAAWEAGRGNAVTSAKILVGAGVAVTAGTAKTATATANCLQI